MRVVRFFLGLALCAFLVSEAAHALAGVVSEIPFEEMLPEDAIFYFSVPDAAGLVSKFKGSNAYKIIREIDPVALMSRERRFQQVKELYGAFIQPLTLIFQERIALAVRNIPPGPGVPGVILLADITSEEKALRQYLTERIHPLVKQRGMQMISFTHGGHEVQQFSLPGPMPLTVCYAIADKVFIATLGRATIEELLALQRREKPLARSQLFQQVRQKVGQSSSLFVYVNSSALLEGVGPGMPPQVKGLLTALGLTGVKALGMGQEWRGPSAKQTWFVATGPERTGLLSLIGRKARPLKVERYVPGDATFLFAVSLGEFERFWDEVLGTVKDVGHTVGGDKDWERIAARLQQWEKRAGLRIKEDILGPFGGEVCIAVKVPEVLGVPPMMAFVEVKDAQAAKALVERLVGVLQERLGGMALRATEEYKGVAISSLTLLPRGRGIGLEAAALVRPAFAVVGDFLVVGLQSRQVKNVVDVLESGRSLKESPEFKRVVGNLAEQGSMTFYLNVREVYDLMYSAFGSFAARHVPPDLIAKLGRIGPYLGSVAGRLSCDEGGITYEVFSDSGLADQAPFLLALGWSVPTVARARGRAESVACLSNVRQLAIACTMYATDHDGVLPSKLSELYPNYVAELNVFVCPANAEKKISGARIDEESDYVLRLPGMKMAEVKDAAKTVMLWEKEARHAGRRNAGFADGHIEALPANMGPAEPAEKAK